MFLIKRKEQVVNVKDLKILLEKLPDDTEVSLARPLGEQFNDRNIVGGWTLSYGETKPCLILWPFDPKIRGGKNG